MAGTKLWTLLLVPQSQTSLNFWDKFLRLVSSKRFVWTVCGTSHSDQSLSSIMMLQIRLMFGVKWTITRIVLPFVQVANDSFVPCFAFVLCIMTSAVSFYMEHKPQIIWANIEERLISWIWNKIQACVYLWQNFMENAKTDQKQFFFVNPWTVLPTTLEFTVRFSIM